MCICRYACLYTYMPVCVCVCAYLCMCVAVYVWSCGALVYRYVI